MAQLAQDVRRFHVHMEADLTAYYDDNLVDERYKNLMTFSCLWINNLTIYEY